jgi:hypothetical protein
MGRRTRCADGLAYVDPMESRELFAADTPSEQADFMARPQVFG